MSIEVGTASWTDATLIKSGRFYPKGCTSAEARLRFYAEHFPMVEVDASYYAMPSAANSALWAQRTPPGFTFNMKAFRLFTGHQTEPKFFPPDIQQALPQTGKKNLYYRDLPPDIVDELWRRFFEALEPLRVAGKLGAVLFQFAPWVTTARRDHAHVAHCADRMAPYLTAFEFRNASWFDDRHRAWTLAFERERGLVHVVMDAPDVTTRAHTVWEATSARLAIVRLHGRNAETWSGSTTAAGRFNYDYSDEELEQLTLPIREIAKRVDRTDVVFNNCFEDSAQRNALTMIRLLNRHDPGSASSGGGFELT
ncbi:DUF72 domain-containing protein [Paraburkholderia rhizosphaerae]|uniref:Uncharacterized protein YecE (DUF72 family) n=1 Tax=Paraburkholderia rhizosphaerae TaxID=480658 RepID=A0A4R8M1H0_9BURK|nr:DUF72 domain-containing protein [Paraburkholderia rhizosphaerae]TDY53970.1 uncharacterized protein YecE (DUF72 family) [Paraburkholderia rhizosphaerae]